MSLLVATANGASTDTSKGTQIAAKPVALSRNLDPIHEIQAIFTLIQKRHQADCPLAGAKGLSRALAEELPIALAQHLRGMVEPA